MTPDEKLTGKALEGVIMLDRDYWDRQATAPYTLGRYGVQGAMFGDEFRPMRSLPDFEGVYADGRQFIFDGKVCSGASFRLDKFDPDRPSTTQRQLSHMLKRSRFSVVCFFLVHFNFRELRTKTDPPATIAIPVGANVPVWRGYLRGEVRGISRAQAADYGIEIPWWAPPRAKKPRVNLSVALDLLRERKDDEEGNVHEKEGFHEEEGLQEEGQAS